MTYLTTLTLPLDALTPYPGNPRQGNLAVIERSLTAHAQYRAVVVQARDPEHPEMGGTILAGNHTAAAARNLGWTHLRAELHHVTDDTAARIVAVDNRAADLGDYDSRLLAELLGSLPDLDGTGYDPGDLERLARHLDEADTPEAVRYNNSGSDNLEPPREFTEFSSRIQSDHECPECGHEWAGKCK